jgi:hypothetical protein
VKGIALQQTKLTKDLVDSGTVVDLSRVFTVHEGTELDIKAIALQEKQFKRYVTFATGLGPSRYNSWYLFPAHWRIDGEPRTDYIEATEAKAAQESTPTEKRPLDWWDTRDDLISKYFTEFEVTKGDSRRIPAKNSQVEKNILTMAGELDKVRNEWGSGIHVTSWYRPLPVNLEVGGVRNSTHIDGRGIDIYAGNGDDWGFEEFLNAHWGGGLGYGVASGRGFTHLDLREGGWRRGAGTIRWTY